MAKIRATAEAAPPTGAPPAARPAPPTAGDYEEYLIGWAIGRDRDATLAAAREALRQAQQRAQDLIERGTEVPTLRQALRRRGEASARLAMVEATLAGGDPSWEGLSAGIEAEAAEAMIRLTMGSAHGVGALVGRLAQYLSADRGELEGLRADLESADSWSVFDQHERQRHLRALALARRIPVREAAIDTFRDRFAARIRALVESNRKALESGAHDLLRLSEQAATPAELAAAEGELTEVRRRLALVAGPGGTIAPGPRSARLREEEAELVARLERLSREHGEAIENEVRSAIDRAAAGDLAGWTELAQLVIVNPDAFPAGLGADLQAVGSEAMVQSDVWTWANAVEGSSRGGADREFD